MCANLRAGTCSVVVRFSGLVVFFVKYDPELPSLRFALSQFNFIVRILELSSGRANLRDEFEKYES